jgi:putative SOS response-associated peptidase YedK
MCNRFRGLRDWNDIPRRIAASRINFDYNPNVAPTESVPAFLVERGEGEATKIARFGINLKATAGKKRPPLLNARTDSLRRGSFKTMLAERRCVIPAEGFYEWREEDGKRRAAANLLPRRRCPGARRRDRSPPPCRLSARRQCPPSGGLLFLPV